MIRHGFFLSQFKPQIQEHTRVDFCEYIVKKSACSLPTPSSGATSGTDYFIEVLRVCAEVSVCCDSCCCLQVYVNTTVRTEQFSGLAKYVQLTIYVDNIGVPSLKEVNFHA